ncbi:MAG TPA: tyrosine-protein phosphatase [Pyrinomonadaceae bacterium]|nr:tyrosine-protein phosphatase [Pyrinomonadaceae bacterium]
MIRSSRSYLSVLFAVISLVLASSISALSQEQQENSKNSVTNVSIKNFGQMDDRFFRGAQPKAEEFQELAALGVKTVIDLRDDPEEYEKRSVEALGMRYVNIPMIAKKYPEAAQVEQFIKLVDDPATGKFYVHCAGGRHRTGAMGAVYRFNHYNWNFDQVYAEMKKYDFYTRFGHGDFKKFVQDYAVSYHQKATAAAAATASQK